MTSSLVYSVAVATKIDKLLAYSATEVSEISSDIIVGALVRVPIGRRLETGVVVNIGGSESNDLKDIKLRSIDSVYPSTYWLNQNLLDTAQWMATYYHQSLNKILSTMLPSAILKASAISLKAPTLWRVVASEDAIEQLSRTPRQRVLYDWLEQHPLSSLSDIASAGFGRELANKLHKKHLISEHKTAPSPLPSTKEFVAPTLKQGKPKLTAEQQQTMAKFRDHDKPKPFLLNGVTGSGKTEIYMRASEPLLLAGMQILVLVPEIGLVSQTRRGFENRFTAQIYVYTSECSDSEKRAAWQSAASGEPAIFIGTRSAIFLPLSNPGLMVLDEEHDLSYKQQEGLRYNARDLAIVRSKSLEVPIILGSATPSLESLKNVAEKAYEYLELNQRVHLSKMPKISLHKIENTQLLSQESINKIAQKLEAGLQALVFVNRRGYAPRTVCSNCGWLALCPKCDSALCRHLNPPRLVCHHCDYQQAYPTKCPSCMSTNLINQGKGTEQLEMLLKRLFKDKPCIRIDRDSTSRKGAFENRIDQVKQESACILVGTQMLAKGHHLPKLALAVVCDADYALFSHDFRAQEHLGQLIIQVAGRTGRGETEGELLIETSYPEHPIWEQLKNSSHREFVATLAKQRQERLLPPYSYGAILRAESVDVTKLIEFMNKARSMCRPYEGDVDFVGPIPAVLEKKQNRYRYQMLLTSVARKHLHRCMFTLTDGLGALKNRSQIRWAIDVDPQTLD